MQKLTFLSATLLFAFLGCKSKNEEKAAPVKSAQQNAALVDVLVAQPKSISSRVETNGTVVANEYVELHPEINGRLTYLNVPEGAYVTQGTVIAKVYDADLRAQLDKSKVQLDLAEKNEERLRKLLSVSGVNQSDYDNALSAVNGYKADIQYTESILVKTVIKAPFSGVLGLRQVSPGAYITPANIIATLQQVDKVKIDFVIPEKYTSLIVKGKKVTILLDQLKQTKALATIIATEPQINQNTRNLKVRAILDNVKINPGAFVKVVLDANTDNKAILVPTGSIIPDDKDKQLIVVKNGKAKFITVETGVREAGFVEVTSGVNPGDSVVVSGVLFARPNSLVKIKAVKTLDQLAN
ncbi:MAG: efflux RND transporter periplasmic adaptor subunit [Sphingobacteriia bacterium]|nr:efflux RND transporter periplasmic adaptor subunit [Sphingobacteriia bacterium]